MSKAFSQKEDLVLKNKAKELRKTILTMIYKAQASHIASAFSVLDILVFLYDQILLINPDKPNDSKRDKLILSKGWGVSALYSVLSDKKFFSKKLLESYCMDGSKFVGISTLNGIPGIEATTGSMGHGLPLGAGMAVAAKKIGSPNRVFVVIGDGELDEGSTWEAILFAGFQKLDNLIAIIDYNGLQSFGFTKDVLDAEPIADKFRAFRWNVCEMDGHNFVSMNNAFSFLNKKRTAPTLIIAHTIKGKGVSFMENKNEWHYKYPNREQFEMAMKELKNI